MCLHCFLRCPGPRIRECTNCFRKLEREKEEKWQENTRNVIREQKKRGGDISLMRYTKKISERYERERGAARWVSLSNNNFVLLRALKMAVLSYYYFGEKTNDGARLRYVKRRGEERQRAKALGITYHGMHEVVWVRVYTLTYTCATHSNLAVLSLSLSPFLIFGVSLRTTDRAENIGTPYVFPETRGFIEAIMPAIRAKTKTSL